MSYRITGLDPTPFVPLYGLSDDALAAHGARRMTVTETPGAPCRITLADADPGETVLLLNHEHLTGDTPYRARHAIFVREGADVAADYRGTVPEAMRIRLLSVRAFDAAAMMIDADVFDGGTLDARLRGWFADPAVAFVDIHNARRGCFAGRARRA